MTKGEEIGIELEPGKTLVLKLLTVGDAQPDSKRTVYFELNGQPREITVQDRGLVPTGPVRVKAESGNMKHIAAPMPGAVVAVAVKTGDKVAAGQKLITLEAMKMESTIYAERASVIAEVCAKPGTQVDGGDLLIRLE
jgi:pyruvate carboxylase